MYDNSKLMQTAKSLFNTIIAKGFNDISLHQYTDPTGKTLYTKARLRDSNGKKQLRPFYWDETSKQWQMSEPPFTGKKPLYNWHLLANASTIWIFEGEQKADLAVSLGYTATTTGGSTSIATHDLTPLIGKKLVFWRDFDNAGQKWLSDFLNAIVALNTANDSHANATQGELLAVDVDKLGLNEKDDIMDYMQGLNIEQMQAKMNALPMLDDTAITAIIATATPAIPPQAVSNGASGAGVNGFGAIANQQGQDNSTKREWQAPQSLDIARHFETPYPINSFSKELQAVINEIAYYAQVPQAVAGHSVLGALSAIGQRLVNAPFLGGYIPASLFLITEFPSGQGKSTASRLANKAIIDWEKARYLDYLQAYQEWENLPPKERAISPKPKNQSFIVSDGTIEAVTDKFILDNQSDIYWNSDEAGQFFNGYSMKSDTASSSVSSLIKLWDGSPVNKVRSQRGKATQDKTNAYNARLTLSLTGQRVVLEPAITNPILINQGFLPRALLACPKSFQGFRDFASDERLNANPNDSWHLISFYEKCSNLLASANASKERINMNFADFASKKALGEYMQAVEIKQRTGGQYAHIGAFAGRMGENTARIATLFALFDGQQAVTTDHIKRACQLVDYSINERLNYSDITDDGKTDAQLLSDWLTKKATMQSVQSFGYSEVQSRISPKYLRTASIFQMTVDYLIEKNHIAIEYDNEKRLIVINPYLLK